MKTLSLALIGLALTPALLAQQTSNSELKLALTVPGTTSNGIAIAPDGRKFLVLAKQKDQDVPQIAEWVGDAIKPYPDATWNSWKEGDAETAHKWVHANSIRFGPDGLLWVVDFGNTGMSKPVLPHAVKLVGIDVTTNTVAKAFDLSPAIQTMSAIDDVRFHGQLAYLTDAGVPGLIVLDMPTGHMWRALDHDKSATSLKPLRAEGHQLSDPEGKPIFFHADQLEVSPNGRTLYYQPASGPLSAIETKYLDDEHTPDSVRKQHVRLFADAGSTGGTAIDAAGNIYETQPDLFTIRKITPAGKVTILVTDKRLVWGDAMWITADRKLWIPAAQIDRTASFNAGKQTLELPGKIYTLDIDSGPPVNDHR